MIALQLLCWLVYVHITAIYLFTRGFLLSRLALPNKSQQGQEQGNQRAVGLVKDTLRFDSVSDHPPDPLSPNHHNILTLPRELTAAHPQPSFAFNAYADPHDDDAPTYQRSYPTFVDIGESFSGSVIQEDSASPTGQLGTQGPFMRLFVRGHFADHHFFSTTTCHTHSTRSTSKTPHTVDSGIMSYLPSIIQRCSEPWTLAIGHGLGVDHAGRRVGPDHPVMKAKLEQMNVFLAEVVGIIDEDTLLILLGDRGTITHENVEEKRRQLEEQEQPIGLLRARIALLEGTANSQDALTKQGGTSVDAFSIKNAASQLERLINRWAAEVVRSPPANLDIVYAAAISDITCTK
ncbi:hypothetical protein EDD15DRAFT_2425586 [Pisolithus albus]|nr:hypothetical protein EDD15DRAFT_2425586 [Pisolithus albus]